MDDARRTRVSKYVSKHLRHQPERLGLTLALGGWVPIDVFLEATRTHGFVISRAELDEVVATSDKQRFGYDPTGTLIRANQGHSVEVDLQLEATTPPAVLFHGTGHPTVEAITRNGLLKMSRHHVHLSADIETARKVGARHGRPVVFTVDTGRMHADGHVFYCSDNHVWLVDTVPPTYLRVVEGGTD